MNNWLNNWELWFNYRQIQNEEVEEKFKIDIAMQDTIEKMKLTLTRHKRDKEWTNWDDFKKYMKTKYMFTDFEFARYLKIRQIVQRNDETVEFYY